MYIARYLITFCQMIRVGCAEPWCLCEAQPAVHTLFFLRPRRSSAQALICRRVDSCLFRNELHRMYSRSCQNSQTACIICSNTLFPSEIISNDGCFDTLSEASTVNGPACNVSFGAIQFHHNEGANLCTRSADGPSPCRIAFPRFCSRSRSSYVPTAVIGKPIKRSKWNCRLFVPLDQVARCSALPPSLPSRLFSRLISNLQSPRSHID